MGDNLPVVTTITSITTPAAAHAPLGPSGATWWMGCPGAPAYVKKLGLKRDSGKPAEWGTKAHALAETTLKFVFGLSTEKPVFPEDDPELKEVVEFYVNQLFLNPPCQCNPKTWQIGVETKLPASVFGPNVWGTLDFWCRCPVHHWLKVSDLKTGHTEVEAVGNPQIAIYAILLQVFLKLRIGRVLLEIIQPRSPSGRKVKTWTLEPFDLAELLPMYRRAALATEHPNAPLIAGLKQCQYCAASPVCEERRTMVLRMSGLKARAPSATILTPEQVSAILLEAHELKDWIKGVESLAYQLANRGMKIPRFKLAQKRLGNRKWKSEVEARGLLLKHLNENQIYDSKMKGPAAFDDEIGKEVIDALCTREPGGTVLVPDEEDRPAALPGRPSPFQHLLKPAT